MARGSFFMTPCRLVGSYEHFGVSHCFSYHEDGKQRVNCNAIVLIR